jgi:D-lyxose ketol-isomerase
MLKGRLSMKRSQINNAIDKAKCVLEKQKITLPMFGYWTIDDWNINKNRTKLIRDIMLGWDVTDFGSGNFLKTGAVLFTLRNGDVFNKNKGTPYAEKYIILDDAFEQEIPMHFHNKKTEDIINRGGGTLMVQLYNSTTTGVLDETSDVMVVTDGISKIVPAGGIIEISTGNSITLVPGIYHRFYAKKGGGMLVVGEVSTINDDYTDNVFLNKSARFCQIEEDEKPKYLLVNEY